MSDQFAEPLVEYQEKLNQYQRIVQELRFLRNTSWCDDCFLDEVLDNVVVSSVAAPNKHIYLHIEASAEGMLVAANIRRRGSYSVYEMNPDEIVLRKRPKHH